MLRKDAEKASVTVNLSDETELRIAVKGQERDWELRLVMHPEVQTLQNIKTCTTILESVGK
jgi:hypothetical protein